MQPTLSALDSTPPITKPQITELPYFGYIIFGSGPDSFQLTTPSPVDEGYVVGPDEELH